MYVLALLIMISNIIGTHTRAVTDTHTTILKVEIDEVVVVGAPTSRVTPLDDEVVIVGFRAVDLGVVDIALESLFAIVLVLLVYVLLSCVILDVKAVASDEFEGLGLSSAEIVVSTLNGRCIIVVFVASFEILAVVLTELVLADVAAIVVLFVDAVLIDVVSA